MHLTTSWIQSLSALFVLARLTTAFPADVPAVEKRAKDCWDISIVTFGLFKDNVCKKPPKSTCLFYTKGLSDTAQDYSKADGRDLTTIWEMWEKSYYNDDVKDKNNPLRCIFADDDKRRTYFNIMSDAMAYFCDVSATLMSDKDKKNVPKDGIWYKTEFERLKKTGNAGKVNLVELIDPKGKNRVEYWTRDDNQKREEADTDMYDSAPLMERDTCGAPKSAAAVFDEGGALPVDW